MCPCFDDRNIKLQLSADGVSECLSTTVSLDVYSIKFEKCKTIYPVRVVRPIKKVNIDQLQQLKLVLDDLHFNRCIITQFIGDNLKRAIARQCLCHSGWFPCEYCFAKGTKLVTNSISNKKKGQYCNAKTDCAGKN